MLRSWLINHAKLLHWHLRWKHGRANNTLADDEQEVVGVRTWSRTAASWSTALLRVRTPPPPAAAFSTSTVTLASRAAGYFTRLWRHLQADTGRRTFIVAANGGRLTCLGGQWEKWEKPPRRGTRESCHQWRHLPRHHVYQLRGSATSMFLNQLSCLTSIAFLTQQFRSTFHHLWGELFLCGCETYQ